MEIKRVHIQNFRSIRDLTIELSNTSVLIGPNNAGKTAILDAIRIALTRRWGQRGTGFTEYDIHLVDETADPKTSGPVVIELDFQESAPDEWGQDLRADLDDIVAVDPVTGKTSIFLRVSCAWDEAEESYVPRWQFLNVDKAPLVGRGARQINTQEFFQYLPVFYLDAVRDAADEFTSRSQFWGKLLRSVSIPQELEKRAKRVFDRLNTKLLGADPKLGTITETLSGISLVASADQPGHAQLRMVPLHTWDLISRAEVIFQAEGERPWLPLGRHGQGIQSLSVMFLFQAFVQHLISELYKPESSAVLALEEPETHLHPHAVRSLWQHIENLPGQKIITTHSPYLIQRVPFRDLRIIRFGADGTSVAFLPATFAASILHIEALDAHIAASNGKLQYDRGLNQLIVAGQLTEAECRALLILYQTHPEQPQIHPKLRALQKESSLFISDTELGELETFARRIRGEIFFARRWLLVEGQSDYNLACGLATGLNCDLDAHSISVIDCQNNGSPGVFAGLARALGIPWTAVFDSDDAGLGYVQQVRNRGYTEAETNARCNLLTQIDLEHQLVADGLQPELKSILTGLGVADAAAMDDAALIQALGSHKAAYSAMLAASCSQDEALALRMPQAFRTAITQLPALT